MKGRLLAFSLCTLLLMTCKAGAPNVEPTLAPRSGSNNHEFNLLIVAEGYVQLKREGWLDFHSTIFGTELNRGDQLRLADDAKAVVLCDTLTLWFVPAGGSSGVANGCPQPSEPLLRYPHGMIANSRGENNPLIPYIISPRSTYLLGETPKLRWNAIPGVTQYRVQVRGENMDWKKSIDTNEVIYPGQPPFEPGKSYLLVVQAQDGTSSLEESPHGLGFVVLGQDEASSVQAAQEKLHALNLPASAEAYAWAKLYVTHDLIAEAIEMLEASAAEGSQYGAVYRTLGDLYRQVGLYRLAEEPYMQAITLTQAATDQEGLALTQLGLGEITEALGRREESKHWLTQALDGFKQLGDAQHISEVNQWLALVSP